MSNTASSPPRTIEQAMILAAGYGTRMRPLTDTLPKPLVPVAGRPLVEYALEKLAGIPGLHDAVINISYRAEQMEDYLDRRKAEDGIRVRISREDTPLETGGGILHALPMLGEAPFFVINSDIIWTDPVGEQAALARLAAAWDDTRMDALLLLQPTEKAAGYGGAGDFHLLQSGAVSRFNDQGAATAARPYVFAGVQILHPRLFNHCKPGVFSLTKLYDRQAEDGHAPERGICGLAHLGDWMHVGDPEGVKAAEEYLSVRIAG